MACAPPFRLYLITDRHLAGGWAPLFAKIEQALVAGGADAVQLREKELPAPELYPR